MITDQMIKIEIFSRLPVTKKNRFFFIKDTITLFDSHIQTCELFS